MGLEKLLQWMQERGSSVQLNYGEDTGQWECSWISGGVRFTGIASQPQPAANLAFLKCIGSCPAPVDGSPEQAMLKSLCEFREGSAA